LLLGFFWLISLVSIYLFGFKLDSKLKT